MNVSIANASSKTVKKIKITGACLWMIKWALVCVHKYVVLKFSTLCISHSMECIFVTFPYSLGILVSCSTTEVHFRGCHRQPLLYVVFILTFHHIASCYRSVYIWYVYKRVSIKTRRDVGMVTVAVFEVHIP